MSSIERWSFVEPTHSPSSSVSTVSGSMSPTLKPLDDECDFSPIPAPVDAGTKYSKHKRFYIEDGNMTFLIEKTLYKIHSSFLVSHSPWFATHIAQLRSAQSAKDVGSKEDQLPPGWNKIVSANGKTIYVNAETAEVTGVRPINTTSTPAPPQETIVALDGVVTGDFDSFLSILYPRDYDVGDLSTQAEWTSVLKLSSQWSFASVRSLAIRRLDSFVSPFDRLVLARMYQVEEWAEPALKQLCMRDSPLDVEEIRRMAPEDIAVVTALRERVNRPNSLPGISSDDISEKVKRMQISMKSQSDAMVMSQSGSEEKSSIVDAGSLSDHDVSVPIGEVASAYGPSEPLSPVLESELEKLTATQRKKLRAVEMAKKRTTTHPRSPFDSKGFSGWGLKSTDTE